MSTVVRMMRMPDSGLDIRDRMWLKITIPNAFIGSELVDWLHGKVEGLQDRRDARKYASQLLKANYIKHTVKKTTFSEQCYYVFGDQKNVPSLPTGMIIIQGMVVNRRIRIVLYGLIGKNGLIHEYDLIGES